MENNRLLLPALCIAGLAANISVRTVDPLITTIASDFSVGVTTAALVSSAYALPFALGQPLLGPLGDIYGKIRVLKISVCFLALSLLASALAPSLELLAMARFCAGFAAGGIVPACMATIGDAYPTERRQVAISTFATMGLLAQIFATGSSGIVAEAAGWRYVLFGTGVFGVLAAITTFVIFRNQPGSGRSFSFGLAASNYRSVFRNPKAVLCYSTVFLEGVALFGILPYVAEIFRQRGGGGAAEAGIVIGALGAGGLLYIATVSLLLRRFTRPHLMAAGGLLLTCAPLGLAAGLRWPLVAAAFVIAGFGFMLLHNSIQTETVDLAPAARQSAYSLHALSFFAGQASGPPVIGAAVLLFGTSLTLAMSAATLAATGLVISRLFRRLAPT